MAELSTSSYKLEKGVKAKGKVVNKEEKTEMKKQWKWHKKSINVVKCEMQRMSAAEQKEKKEKTKGKQQNKRLMTGRISVFFFFNQWRE